MIYYNPSSAAAYGLEFGNMEQNGIFKRMGDNDCTNFISQCVWAGYGGADGYSYESPPDIEALRLRVQKNYRQTWAWFGRNYTSSYELATPAFIRVEGFWDYVTNNTSEGPRAIGYNNQQHWSKMDILVETGDVLQFYHPEIHRYGHSAIIVSDTHLPIRQAIYHAYNAQHSADYSYRPLLETVMANGGLEDAKIRILKFQPWNE